MTHALRAALDSGASVHAVVKPATRVLLAPAFPAVTWIEFSAPWTAFRGKYQLHHWPWQSLGKLINALGKEYFTDGFSPRPDPRDHLLLYLAGVQRRYGFRHRLSLGFLNEGLTWPDEPHHRADDWAALMAKANISLPSIHPTLPTRPYADQLPAQLAELPRPWVALHAGAAQPVRRWPETRWREVIAKLRCEMSFSLILMPDPGGHGEGLTDLADATLQELSLTALAATLSEADALLAHDSGPAHIAAALGTPVFAVMGPNYPERFGPRHPDAAILHDPQCPHFPCRDYCHFDEPRCLTRLKADDALKILIPWLKKNLRPSP